MGLIFPLWIVRSTPRFGAHCVSLSCGSFYLMDQSDLTTRTMNLCGHNERDANMAVFVAALVLLT